MIKIKNICFIWITFLIFITSVEAASFNISSNVKEIEPNKTFTIKVGGDCIGRVNLTVSNGSLSSSSVWVEEGYVNVSVTAATSGKVTVTATPTKGFSDSDANIYNPGSKSVTVTIASPKPNPEKPTPEQKPSNEKPTIEKPNTSVPNKEKSNDNNLKSLEIKEGELSPKFDKNITEYTLLLKENTAKVTVNAVANHPAAKINGAKEILLKPGNNSIMVQVIAENQKEKIYTIKVYVEETPKRYVNYNQEKIGILNKNVSLEGFQKIEEDIFLYQKENIYLIYGINEEKETNFYVWNKETNKIDSKVIPLKINNKTLFVTDKIITIENTKLEKIKINDTEVPCYKWEKNENYCFLNILKENNTHVNYLYEKTENTIQLAPVFDTCEENKEKKNILIIIFLSLILLLENIVFFFKKRRKK